MVIPTAIIESPLRLKVADFLNTILVSNRFVFLSIWSVVHFLFFVLSTIILLKTKLKKITIFLILLGAAVIYEILEWFAYSKWFIEFFIPETGVDIIWDIIIATIAILLILGLSKKKS